MKLGIMQPYFVPYLGYWQLMNQVDTYVVYDDVNFIKNGWINRNRILVNGAPVYYRLNAIGASPNKLINEVSIDTSEKTIAKSLKTIEQAYKKAPYFEEVYPLISEALAYETDNLADYLHHTIVVIKDALDMNTEIVLSSQLDKNCSLAGSEKVIHICKLLGATEYYNAIGGKELYSRDDFANNGIELKFLQMHPISYPQFKNEFEPGLSIIDVLMFNGIEGTKSLLNAFDIE